MESYKAMIVFTLFASGSALKLCGPSDKLPQESSPASKYSYQWVGMNILDVSFYGSNNGMSLKMLSDRDSFGLNWNLNISREVTAKGLKVDLQLFRKAESCWHKELDVTNLEYCNYPSSEVNAYNQLFGFPYGGFNYCPYPPGMYTLQDFKLSKLPSVFKKGETLLTIKFIKNNKAAVQFGAVVKFS